MATPAGGQRFCQARMVHVAQIDGMLRKLLPEPLTGPLELLSIQIESHETARGSNAAKELHGVTAITQRAVGNNLPGGWPQDL
jgi:hypothetical protein